MANPFQKTSPKEKGECKSKHIINIHIHIHMTTNASNNTNPVVAIEIIELKSGIETIRGPQTIVKGVAVRGNETERCGQLLTVWLDDNGRTHPALRGKHPGDEVHFIGETRQVPNVETGIEEPRTFWSPLSAAAAAAIAPEIVAQ